MDTSRLPFSLFDFFALFFPGAIAAFAIYLYFNPDLNELRSFNVDIPLTLGFIIISYILGHVFHAASEIIIDRLSNATIGSMVGQYLERRGLARPVAGNRLKALRSLLKIDWDPDILFEWKEKSKGGDKKTTDSLDKETGEIIKHCLESEFHMVPKKINHAFQLILVFSQKNTKGETNEVPIFAALEAMFRSLALATTLLFGVLLLKINPIITTVDLLKWSALLLLLIGLFIYSYYRYKRMWVETIFAQFIVSSSGKHFRAGGTPSKPHLEI